jgi:hypothetical protein
MFMLCLLKAPEMGEPGFSVLEEAQ